MSRLRIDPTDTMPLWSQIEEGVRRLVASGALVPGSAVSSVRDLAWSLRVNPATVSKAYQRLVDAGVLEVKRGEGTYVSSSPPLTTRAERARELREGAGRYATVALTLGASREEAVDALKAAWTEGGRRTRGEGR